MKLRLIHIIICIATSIAMIAQVTYRTAELERLSSVLGVNPTVLPADGYSYQTVKGRQIVIGTKARVVSHIGLQLFNEDMRRLDKSPVFDFLERYFLQLTYPPVSTTTVNMVRDDQFRFLKGSLTSVAELKPTDSFSYSLEHNTYTATWKRDSQDFLQVSFPAEYELISGENKKEAEENIAADILQTAVVVDTVRESDQPAAFYMLPEISARLYFRKGQLTVSGSRQEQSTANMMLTTATPGNWLLAITQISYGFQKKQFEVSLKQWITFCRNSGCQLYFGVDHVEKDGTVCGVVLAVNETENYNHVLTVQVPMTVIDQREGSIEARLYPYIPTHNVRALFAKFKSSNPKEINS